MPIKLLRSDALRGYLKYSINVLNISEGSDVLFLRDWHLQISLLSLRQFFWGQIQKAPISYQTSFRCDSAPRTSSDKEKKFIDILKNFFSPGQEYTGL